MAHDFLEARLDDGYGGRFDCGVKDVAFFVDLVAADMEVGAEGLDAG